ncbi:MAG: PorT family protein [Bacteroidales bacterium]|jgi:hypothetical protein|nr:PorT family protein [Bacteroidales bacterium]
MKRISLLLTIIFLFGNIVFSQESSQYSYKKSEKPTFLIGIDIVPIINFISTSVTGYKSSGVTFSVKPMLYGDVLLTKNISISVGLAYNTKGGKIIYQQNIIVKENTLEVDDEVSSVYTCSYIEFPLMLKAFTSEYNKWSFCGGIGFSPGLRVMGKASDQFTNLHYVNIQNNFSGTFLMKHNFTKEVKLFGLSADIRLAAEYKLSRRTSLTFGLCGNIGLLNAFSKASATRETNFRGNLYQFGVFAGITL